MLRKFQAIVLPFTGAMGCWPCSRRESAATIGPRAAVIWVALVLTPAGEMSSAPGDLSRLPKKDTAVRSLAIE
jgi:hypothetical protein